MDDFAYHFGRRATLLTKEAALGAIGSAIARAAPAAAKAAPSLFEKSVRYGKNLIRPQVSRSVSRLSTKLPAAESFGDVAKGLYQGARRSFSPNAAATVGGRSLRYGNAAANFARRHPWITAGALGSGVPIPTGIPITQNQRDLLSYAWNNSDEPTWKRLLAGLGSGFVQTPGLGLIPESVEPFVYGGLGLGSKGLLNKAIGGAQVAGGVAQNVLAGNEEDAPSGAGDPQIQALLQQLMAQQQQQSIGEPTYPDYYSGAFAPRESSSFW